MRTIIRAPARFYGTRVRLLLGASSCSAKSKASVVVPERSAPRTPCGVSGPVWQEPGCGNRAAASIPGGRPVRYARPNWRHANLVAFTPMCRVSPDCNVTNPPRCTCRNVPPGRRDGKPVDVMPRKCERRPWPGRRCKTTSGLATKRAPSLSARPVATGPAWLDTPPAAGRAWVPGCRARTSERP